MIDFWRIGPTAAGVSLRAYGFSPREAERLVALKLRCERGDFRELTDENKRLLFVRWLVKNHLLDDWPSAQSRCEGRRLL